MKKFVLICLLMFSLSLVGKAQTTPKPVAYEYLLLTLDEVGRSTTMKILKGDGTKEDVPLSSSSIRQIGKIGETFDGNNEIIVNTLKKLGEQGWELTGVSDVTVPEQANVAFTRYIFKRVKQ